MIYHFDRTLDNWRAYGVRAVYYLSNQATVLLYWYARKRGEFPPPLKRRTLRSIFTN